MVINQINVRRIPTFEAKNDPHVVTNSDAPMAGEFALKRMEPESRQAHVLRSDSAIKPCQHTSDFVRMLRTEAAVVIILV